MITVITGTPGSGKTSLAVALIKDIVDRPVFVMGIKELKVPHEVTPPVSEWTEMRPSPEDPDLRKACFTFPPRSIVVVDEAQTIFRPRAVGSKVPAEVAAFETHRHEGIDFILITQHVGLLDPNLRKLVDKHLHIHGTFLGRVLHEWVGLGDPESTSSRQIAAKKTYRPDRSTFGLYKSAEVHTKVKRRLPVYAWVFVVAVIGAVGLGFYAYKRISERAGFSPVASSPVAGPSAPSGASSVNRVKTVAEYVADSVPRVPGLAHTAPRYDSITEPVDAPFPVGCVLVSAYRDRPERCRCVDQQGNDYDTTAALCRHIVAHGMFWDWRPRVDAPQAQPAGGPVPGTTGGAGAAS